MDKPTAETFNNIVPIKKVGDYIPFAPKTLRNWRSCGKYPQIFVKIGGRVFVDLKELQDLIEAQKAKAVKDAKRLGLN